MFSAPIVITGDGLVPPRMRVPVTVTVAMSVVSDGSASVGLLGSERACCSSTDSSPVARSRSRVSVDDGGSCAVTSHNGSSDASKIADPEYGCRM
jgi:hypothetical protein